MFLWDKGRLRMNHWRLIKSHLPHQGSDGWHVGSSQCVHSSQWRLQAGGGLSHQGPYHHGGGDSRSIFSLGWVAIWSCQTSFPQETKVLFGAY